MNLAQFRSLSHRDFENGAVLDELERVIEQREALLNVCHNLVTTLGIMSMPRLDGNVADNTTLLRILTESLRAAVDKAEGTP